MTEKKRILIVDDDAQVQEMLRDELEDTEIATVQRRGADGRLMLGAMMAMAGDLPYLHNNSKIMRKVFGPPPKPKEVTEYDKERQLKAENRRLRRNLKRLRDMKKSDR